MEKNIVVEIASPRRPRRLRRRIATALILLVVLAAGIIGTFSVAPLIHAAAPNHPASSCAQPPAGKDLTRLSSQQLQAYGIPPILTNRPDWKTLATHFKHRYCHTEQTATSLSQVQHGLMQPANL